MKPENTNNLDKRQYYVFFHDLTINLLLIRARARSIKLKNEKDRLSNVELDALLNTIDKDIEKATKQVEVFMRELQDF
jgi:hypothetical protein